MTSDDAEEIDIHAPTDEELTDLDRRAQALLARMAAIPEDRKVLLDSPKFSTPLGADANGHVKRYKPKPRPEQPPEQP